MTTSGEITTIMAGREFRVCPACGYERGFHTSFLGTNTDRDNPVKSTREVYRVILICPECGARFDAGWRVSFSELANKFVKAPVASPSTPHAARVTPLPALPPHEEPPSE